MMHKYGNDKIGFKKSANGAPDASAIKEKTSGGKSEKSATMLKTHNYGGKKY
jgi:hypothetical protein